jgi:hypothetical protein
MSIATFLGVEIECGSLNSGLTQKMPRDGGIFQEHH